MTRTLLILAIVASIEHTDVIAVVAAWACAGFVAFWIYRQPGAF